MKGEIKHNQEGGPDRYPKGCLIVFQIVFIGPAPAHVVIYQAYGRMPPTQETQLRYDRSLNIDI